VKYCLVIWIAINWPLAGLMFSSLLMRLAGKSTENLPTTSYIPLNLVCSCTFTILIKGPSIKYVTLEGGRGPRRCDRGEGGVKSM